jgi:UDP-N-acetylglucosamine 3-dehydrogenase
MGPFKIVQENQTHREIEVLSEQQARLGSQQEQSIPLDVRGKMEKNLDIAVLGAGYWGRKVIAEYLQLAAINPKVTLSKVCDMKDENLEYCSEVLRVDKAKLDSDYDTLLSSGDVDALHICTPNETHHKFCLAALNAGKHVLLEKPMALSAREAWELDAISRHNHLCLQVGHIYRFNNALKKVRDLIAENYFGSLYYLKLQWTTLMPSPIGRDIIFDLGPHPVDIVNYLLSRWPIRVNCTGRAYRRKLLEEVAYISMEFDEQMLAHIELSWLQPGKVRELIVMGEKRSATVDCVDQIVRIFDNKDGSSFALDLVPNNTILSEVGHFANSIITNSNHRNPGSVGANTVAVLESIRRSMKEHKTVNVGLDT